MTIITGEQIRAAIEGCKPEKIAVAYIGRDWGSFIKNAEELKAVVISPTLGTNPLAVRELARVIGWDKIYFLDDLHAKIYIGQRSAILGSANLTMNGLHGERLLEAGTIIRAPADLQRVNELFLDIIARASTKYPTLTSKLERLKELEVLRGAAVASTILPCSENQETSFSDFELLGDDHFYVSWYQKSQCNHSDELKAIEDLILDEMHFSPLDPIQKNKWILAWKITNSGKPHKSSRPYWIYIHEVYDNGVTDSDYDYGKCAIQRRDLKTPEEPFEITDSVAAAFRQSLEDEAIAKYFIQRDEEVFSISRSTKGLRPLIERMKQHLDEA